MISRIFSHWTRNWDALRILFGVLGVILRYLPPQTVFLVKTVIISNKMPEQKTSRLDNILYFYKRTDSPIAFDYKGSRLALYHKGEVIRDREGNAVIDEFFLRPEIRQLGVEPFYRKPARPNSSEKKESVVTQPPVETKEVTPEDEDLDSSDVKPKTADTPANTQDKKAEPVGETEKTRQGVKFRVLRTTDIPEKDFQDPEKLVVRKFEGGFLFELDKYKAHSPAKMKRHIKKKFGDELSERVTWNTK